VIIEIVVYYGLYVGMQACGHVGVLYAYKGSHTLFTGQREREREGEKKREEIDR
jgi:hypothetical protein